MPSCKICYFSGTGNTLWSAKKIAEIIGPQCELVSIGVIMSELENTKIDNRIILEADAVILLFPAYAYGLPAAVRNFVKNAELRTSYTAAIVTYGTSPGGALAQIKRLLHRKKITVSWYGRIPSVENYTALFGPQKQKTINKRIEMQQKATKETADRILNRDTNSVFGFRPLSAFISMLFYIGIKVFYKWYKVTGDCDGCETCKKVCPVSAIVMNQGKPEFTKKCEHCQACIQWCPRKAILFGRFRAGTRQYHHPEIGLTDLT